MITFCWSGLISLHWALTNGMNSVEVSLPRSPGLQTGIIMTMAWDEALFREFQLELQCDLTSATDESMVLKFNYVR